MTLEEQRIAIAEACGWTRDGQRFTHPNCAGVAFFPAVFCEKELPDYLGDLNAMHEAEKMLTDEQKDKYTTVLHEVVGNSPFWWAIAHATAAQRAEAFLRTIDKWTTD